MYNSQLQEFLASSGANETLKMNKRGLIGYIAKRNGISVEDAANSYSMVMSAIRDAVTQGVKLSLSGFGTFYRQSHKGQPVQFCENGGSVGDYLVFKFSASKTLNQYLRDNAQVKDT